MELQDVLGSWLECKLRNCPGLPIVLVPFNVSGLTQSVSFAVALLQNAFLKTPGMARDFGLKGWFC